ncbi:MAG: 16S rRNA methyltransferase [Theionarchaea archaeon]|nr:16S rRNA methyltransferase [Theionarchaea archaeon]MBU6999192.1 16S rRNA methyltransferase [Theionarchaea archaeon]MBU7019683.1 16S rRNA methyltransferase [Theionarchaea archaeon]MBU7035840.1 16S rRNA methyltransferase [Theionarchaea archaeon]MBU7041563.1 16S rRNA methyltransferase [Theionarchaea archaeon]
MLTLVVGEAALELVPLSIANHPVVLRSARKRGKPPGAMLLDSNFHHAAMKTLDDAERRGRPDIVHVILLCALESVVARKGDLTLYIHTYNDYCIWVNPETRIPRSYNRFCGLFEQLLEKGSIQNFLKVEEKSLAEILEELPGEKVVLERGGSPFKIQKDAVCVVGGFPHGGFLTELSHPKVAITEYHLPAWTVVNEILVRYELL